MTNKNIIDYTVDNAIEHIREGIHEARKKFIEANTIVLNKGFAMTNNLMFGYKVNDICQIDDFPPMIFGLQVRYQSEPLPNNANFILTKGSESKGKKINDLEEELGIDILTLFNADKIYFKYFEEDTEIKKSHEVHIDLTNRLLRVYAYPEDEFGTRFSFSEYNFLWALTREELEDKDE